MVVRHVTGTGFVISRAGVDAPVFRGREEQWDDRDKQAQKAMAKLPMYGLAPTPYFTEALAYYGRAKLLQEMNVGKRRKALVGDQLQEAIPIYDTVRRRYAGFSNVLEQLWHGDSAPKIKANRARGFDYPKFVGTISEWLYLCLVHRITGSGASFEADHGWRNTVVPTIAALKPRERAPYLLAMQHRPIFTSIGNQIPPFNKKGVDSGARNAGHEYLGITAPRLVDKTIRYLEGAKDKPLGIKQVVDAVLAFQSELGCKQFKFVLTAWVMDMAEYLPQLVDPNSDCYHGKNAQESLSVCLRPAVKMTKQQFFDRGTRFFADWTSTYPMDVEDASPGCDLIRWLENYVPKKGFQHVHDQGIFNCSSLVYPNGRQP